MPIHYAIETIEFNDFDAHKLGLAHLLHVNVLDGASVNFILPFSEQDAATFWRKKVLPALEQQVKTLLIAKVDDQVVGCVMLDCDMPPNQPHRAEIAKLLVHPKFRRNGIARALMVEIELFARQLGCKLLVLDTANEGAERLYQQLGYEFVGIIPKFAFTADNQRLEATTIMYKPLN